MGRHYEFVPDDILVVSAEPHMTATITRQLFKYKNDSGTTLQPSQLQQKDIDNYNCRLCESAHYNYCRCDRWDRMETSHTISGADNR